LATDFASSESVVRHFLMHYAATVDVQPAANASCPVRQTSTTPP